MSKLTRLNGKYYCLTDVVMLPSNTGRGEICLNLKTNKIDSFIVSIHNCFLKFQHLYFLSDEDIKEGDWFLTDIRNNIHENDGNPMWELKQCTHIDNSWIFTKEIGMGFNPDWSKKIIATSDRSLGLSEVGKVGYSVDEFHPLLPEPSYKFIEEFVEQFNIGTTITKVLVEYVVTCRLDMPISGMSFDLKVNSDNTIIIRRDNWDRVEVERLCRKAYSDGQANIIGQDKWIEENL